MIESDIHKGMHLILKQWWKKLCDEMDGNKSVIFLSFTTSSACYIGTKQQHII